MQEFILRGQSRVTDEGQIKCLMTRAMPSYVAARSHQAASHLDFSDSGISCCRQQRGAIIYAVFRSVVAVTRYHV